MEEENENKEFNTGVWQASQIEILIDGDIFKEQFFKTLSFNFVL